MTDRDPHSEDSPSDEPASHDPASDDAAFDDIVSRLDLEWDDPGLIDAPEPEPDPEPEIPPELDFDLDEEPDPVDEQFYRQIPERPAGPLHKGKALAWTGVLGTPLVMVISTMFGVFLSGPLLLTGGLTFVAGSLYLISQLPERGPSHPDWPDDGAAL